MSLKILPESVRNKIRIGLIINSVKNCVQELVENSLDSKATHIAICIDLKTLKLRVLDNGTGMTKQQLELIGTRYVTSKCYSIKDLERNTRYYGYRGEALCCIRDCCSKLIIVSKSDEFDTYCKEFHNAECGDVVKSVHSRVSIGTTVIVNDLFNNSPVKQYSAVATLELENIKEYVKTLALIHPKVIFVLRDDARNIELIRTQRCDSIRDVFINLFPSVLKDSDSLCEFSSYIDRVKTFALVSKEVYQSCRLQFLFVNKRFISKSSVYTIFNELLSKSFYLKGIHRGDNCPDGNLSHARKNKYAIFIISIRCPYSEYDITIHPSKCLVEFKNFNLVKKCVEQMAEKYINQELSANKKEFRDAEDIIEELLTLHAECSKKIEEVNPINNLNFQKLVNSKSRTKEFNTRSTVYGMSVNRLKNCAPTDKEVYSEIKDDDTVSIESIEKPDSLSLSGSCASSSSYSKEDSYRNKSKVRVKYKRNEKSDIENNFYNIFTDASKDYIHKLGTSNICKKKLRLHRFKTRNNECDENNSSRSVNKLYQQNCKNDLKTCEKNKNSFVRNSEIHLTQKRKFKDRRKRKKTNLPSRISKKDHIVNKGIKCNDYFSLSKVDKIGKSCSKTRKSRPLFNGLEILMVNRQMNKDFNLCEKESSSSSLGNVNNNLEYGVKNKKYNQIISSTDESSEKEYFKTTNTVRKKRKKTTKRSSKEKTLATKKKTERSIKVPGQGIIESINKPNKEKQRSRGKEKLNKGNLKANRDVFSEKEFLNFKANKMISSKVGDCKFEKNEKSNYCYNKLRKQCSKKKNIAGKKQTYDKDFFCSNIGKEKNGNDFYENHGIIEHHDQDVLQNNCENGFNITSQNLNSPNISLENLKSLYCSEQNGCVNNGFICKSNQNGENENRTNFSIFKNSFEDGVKNLLDNLDSTDEAHGDEAKSDSTYKLNNNFSFIEAEKSNRYQNYNLFGARENNTLGKGIGISNLNLEKHLSLGCTTQPTFLDIHDNKNHPLPSYDKLSEYIVNSDMKRNFVFVPKIITAPTSGLFPNVQQYEEKHLLHTECDNTNLFRFSDRRNQHLLPDDERKDDNNRCDMFFSGTICDDETYYADTGQSFVMDDFDKNNPFIKNTRIFNSNDAYRDTLEQNVPMFSTDFNLDNLNSVSNPARVFHLNNSSISPNRTTSNGIADGLFVPDSTLPYTEFGFNRKADKFELGDVTKSIDSSNCRQLFEDLNQQNEHFDICSSTHNMFKLIDDKTKRSSCSDEFSNYMCKSNVKNTLNEMEYFIKQRDESLKGFPNFSNGVQSFILPIDEAELNLFEFDENADDIKTPVCDNNLNTDKGIIPLEIDYQSHVRSDKTKIIFKNTPRSINHAENFKYFQTRREGSFNKNYFSNSNENSDNETYNDDDNEEKYHDICSDSTNTDTYGFNYPDKVAVDRSEERMNSDDANQYKAQIPDNWLYDTEPRESFVSMKNHDRMTVETEFNENSNHSWGLMLSPEIQLGKLHNKNLEKSSFRCKYSDRNNEFVTCKQNYPYIELPGDQCSENKLLRSSFKWCEKTRENLKCVQKRPTRKKIVKKNFSQTFMDSGSKQFLNSENNDEINLSNFFDENQKQNLITKPHSKVSRNEYEGNKNINKRNNNSEIVQQETIVNEDGANCITFMESGSRQFLNCENSNNLNLSNFSDDCQKLNLTIKHHSKVSRNEYKGDKDIDKQNNYSKIVQRGTENIDKLKNNSETVQQRTSIDEDEASCITFVESSSRQFLNCEHSDNLNLSNFSDDNQKLNLITKHHSKAPRNEYKGNKHIDKQNNNCETVRRRTTVNENEANCITFLESGSIQFLNCENSDNLNLSNFSNDNQKLNLITKHHSKVPRNDYKGDKNIDKQNNNSEIIQQETIGHDDVPNCIAEYWNLHCKEIETDGFVTDKENALFNLKINTEYGHRKHQNKFEKLSNVKQFCKTAEGLNPLDYDSHEMSPKHKEKEAQSFTFMQQNSKDINRCEEFSVYFNSKNDQSNEEKCLMQDETAEKFSVYFNSKSDQSYEDKYLMQDKTSEQYNISQSTETFENNEYQYYDNQEVNSFASDSFYLQPNGELNKNPGVQKCSNIVTFFDKQEKYAAETAENESNENDEHKKLSMCHLTNEKVKQTSFYFDLNDELIDVDTGSFSLDFIDDKSSKPSENYSNKFLESFSVSENSGKSFKCLHNPVLNESYLSDSRNEKSGLQRSSRDKYEFDLIGNESSRELQKSSDEDKENFTIGKNTHKLLKSPDNTTSNGTVLIGFSANEASVIPHLSKEKSSNLNKTLPKNSNGVAPFDVNEFTGIITTHLNQNQRLHLVEYSSDSDENLSTQLTEHSLSCSDKNLSPISNGNLSLHLNKNLSPDSNENLSTHSEKKKSAHSKTHVTSSHHIDEQLLHNKLPADNHISVSDIKNTAQNTDINITDRSEINMQQFCDIDDTNVGMYFEKLENGISLLTQEKLESKLSNNVFRLSVRNSYMPKGMFPMVHKYKQKVSTPLSTSEKDTLHEIVHHFGNFNVADNIRNDNSPTVPNLCKVWSNFAAKVHPNGSFENANDFIRFTKDDLSTLKFLGQVDNRFLCATMKSDSVNLIVLLDQHAVDERIRVENLLNDHKSREGTWKNIHLNPPVMINVSSSDILIISEYSDRFLKLGLTFQNVSTDLSHEKLSIACNGIPACIYDRYLREGVLKESILIEFIESLIQEVVDQIKHSCGVIASVPNVLQEILNYEACKGAIKFGEKISNSTCISLLKDLQHCQTPFQCAHGRPLLIPLIDIRQLQHFSHQTIKGPDLSVLQDGQRTQLN